MESIKIADIVRETNGILIGDIGLLNKYVDDVVTDSRIVTNNSLYVPIIGENHDGHKFIDSAFENGCAITLSQYELEQDVPYIKVESTFAAYKELAEYYRKQFDIKVIGITGSVGKTTAKDMIASVLSQKYEVLKNQGNLNNEIGLPRTLFGLNSEHEIAVVEMGMNNFGEISRLSKTARPDVCVIMNIGESHIGNLGSREGIFQAKMEIFDYIHPDGVGFVNGDDDKLSSLRLNSNYDIRFFGKSDRNDAYVKNIESMTMQETKATLSIDGYDLDVVIPVPGEHMVYSVLCAVQIGMLFGMTDDEIVEGIKNYKPAKMRVDAIKEDITIINDCYNSCKESIIAGVDVLTKSDTRKIAILGDILEVGEHGERVHYEVGEVTAQKGIDIAVFCGEMSENGYNGYKKNSKSDVMYFKTKQELINKLGDIIKKGDTVYVKASRGCQFEKIVDALKELSFN